ncbi:putative replication initiation protein [Staphylococcus epidermidis]|uniref:replication initiator protein A n=1 Tax=Staphylococcus epidermidis TaxID=1282 RepID=UPI000E04BB45|nr:replication initiator protein A [Staphylococcus epidermidis]SUM53550.1 putative replication initiation protein [Staphylococcus epidermidis]
MEKGIKNKVATNVTCDAYLKIYKFLLCEEDYKVLSSDAKLFYSQIANKQARDSKTKKDYVDENGSRYIVYKRADMIADMKCSKNKIIKLKEELKEAGLIEEVQVKGNKPNRLFVLPPNIDNVTSTYKKGNTVKLAFAKLPKFLLDHDYYRNLSNNSILLYTVLRDRFSLSLENSNHTKSYVDNKGKVYCVFNNKMLATILNISEPTLIKYKNELIAIGLLKQESVGINKTNRLYLYEPQNLPEVNETKEQLASKPKYLLTNRSNKYFARGLFYKSKGSNNLVHKDQEFKSSNTSSNNTFLSNTSSNDMYDMYSDSLTNQPAHNNQNTNVILFDSSYKEALISKLPKQLGTFLNNFSYNELQEVKAVILKGKASFNKKWGVGYTLENVEHSLISMLKRIHVKRIEQGESITALAPFIMTSVYNVFKDYHEECHNSESEELPFSNEETKQNFKQHLENLFGNNVSEPTPAIRSKEMTPKWLDNPDYTEDNYVEDPYTYEERKAFLAHLEKRWG